MAPQLWTGSLQRIFLIVVIAIFLACPPIVSPVNAYSGASGDASIHSLGPVVSGTNQNSSTISIVADSACSPVLEYSNDSFFSGSGGYNRVLAGRKGNNHSFRISGLEPATLYHYQVRGCGVPENDRTFSTFPATGSCSFIVYGDTREQAPIYNQSTRHKLVAERIAQEQDIRFVVNSGDLVSDSDDPAEWSRFFNATDKLRSVTTYNAVPGNHDSNRTLFRELFGTDSPTFYDCGNTRIAMLDSTDLSPMTGKEQALWLTSALLPFNGTKIVIMHYPPFSSDEKHYGGWEDIQNTLVPAFKESGVSLVFSSHVHAFEQIERDGITYIIEARGGAPSYPLNATRIPGSIRSYENTLGYSRVTVDQERGEIQIGIVRVADVSGDLRSVVRVYPEGTVDAEIRIPSGRVGYRFPFIPEFESFIKDFKEKSEGRVQFTTD